MNGCASVAGFDPKQAKETLNRWIAHETEHAAREITASIETYKFNDAAASAYRFVWNLYCDWYLELAKPVLLGPDGAAKRETQAMVAWARDEILKVLHPFMPFITEELWAVTGQHPHLLALSDWPSLEGLADEAAEAEIGWLIDLVTAIRSIRAEMNIASRNFRFHSSGSDQTFERVGRWRYSILRWRVADISAPRRLGGALGISTMLVASTILAVRTVKTDVARRGSVIVRGRRSFFHWAIVDFEADAPACERRRTPTSPASTANRNEVRRQRAGKIEAKGKAARAAGLGQDRRSAGRLKGLARHEVRAKRLEATAHICHLRARLSLSDSKVCSRTLTPSSRIATAHPPPW